MNVPATAAWRYISHSDHAFLRRYLTALREKSPELAWQRFDEAFASLTMELYTEKGWLYHAGGDKFDVVLLIRYNPKRERYVICPLAWGEITPRETLELMVQKGYEFADERQLNQMYVMRPTHVDDRSLSELFEIGPKHSAFRSSLVQDTGDLHILRFERLH